jgi:Excalibur calcium-binding domain
MSTGSGKLRPVSQHRSGRARGDAVDHSQAEAQRFFLANGGTRGDPHKLDRDHDGIACERTWGGTLP